MDGWGQKTLFSFGVKHPKALPEMYRRFLAGLPYYYEDGDFILVHGGVDLSLDDPVRETSTELMVWESSYIPEEGTSEKRRVVCGHKVHSVEAIHHSLNNQVIHLDNGAFTSQQPEHGNLMALNLDSMELFMQPWIDRKAEW